MKSNKRKRTGLTTLLVGMYLLASPFVSYAQEQSYQDCKIHLKADTLTIENNRIKQRFLWNKGQVVPLDLSRKDISIHQDFTQNKLPDFLPFPALLTSKNAEISIQTNQFSPFDPIYLQAEITYFLDNLEIKRTIEIYPKTAAITHYFSIRGMIDSIDTGESTVQNLSMIESEEDLGDIQSTLTKIPLENPHWKMEVVDFKEATDHHNTLTATYEMIAYKKPERTQGNLLLATNKLMNKSFFILKESPLNKSQAAYGGSDFEISSTEVNVMGIGISAEHIQADTWTRAYGYTIGLNLGDKYNLLMDLKKFQRQKRSQLAKRDEMILANTWGDRSKDSRMNEAFILKEIEACSRMGITHLQLDDGWQQGLSKNSASKAGLRWDDWSVNDWTPHKERFPNGFKHILKEANAQNIEICLWFNPSKKNEYDNWERDADILIDFYKNSGIKVFKIDGIELSSKMAELNLRKFFDKINEASEGHVVFNLDVTAGHRMGYFYFMEYGNLFLENRYTDWGNFYPHLTLRNLWMLSHFVPAEKIQIEFLNKWRNSAKYDENDPLAPQNIPFEYQIASTFPGQPLAWMELSQLPEQAFEAADLLEAYKKIQHDFHSGIIMPLGSEPNGLNWTGFQSIQDKGGYFLIFRAYNQSETMAFSTPFAPNQKVALEHILGEGESFRQTTDSKGEIEFTLPSSYSFALYKYRLE